MPLLSVQYDLRCARLHMLLLFAIKSITRAFPDLGRPRSRVPCPSGWLIECAGFGWLFALSCDNVGTRRAHCELRSAAAASDVQWDMNGRRLAQWHVLQPKEAAPGRLLDARTPWCGALQSDSPWSSHSDVSGLEDCRPQTCDLHPRIAETQRNGASQGPRGGGFRCTGACVERRPKPRQFNDILHSNMLKNPTRRTFDLGYRSTDLELPQDQPTVAFVGL